MDHVFRDNGNGTLTCTVEGCGFTRKAHPSGRLPRMTCPRRTAAGEAAPPVEKCRGCGGEKLPQDHPLPAAPVRAANFAKALLRDAWHGRRRRTPAQVARLFAAHCDGCEHLNRDESACSLCGCPVSGEPGIGYLNKLEVASEVCPDGRWPWPAIEKRNLLFYLLPLYNPASVWPWHVEQLRHYLPLFNGRRIVTIATKGPGETLALEPPGKVREAFGDDAASIEFLERPNDRQHWETPAFREMMGLIESTAPAEATFYFHAKGVRRAKQGAIRPWCEEIYRHNLAGADRALESLRYWPCCGIAKRHVDPTNLQLGNGWHFAGTGFWFRHDRLFGRPDWRAGLVDHSHAVEAYLATRFRSSDAHCLAHDEIGDVYDPATWRRAIERVAADAPAANGPTAGDLPTKVSLLVVSRNYARYLRDCLESCFWQTRAADEVLYVDDGSDDDSLAVARAFESKGLKIIPLEHVGVEAARNLAAARSTGDAILFVDGDNVLPENYLEKMLAALTPATPYAYPDMAFFGSQTKYIRQPDFDRHDLWEINIADTCSLMWREAFDAAGGWLPGPWGFMHDYHLFLRAAHFGAPRRADVALGYRAHGASMTAQTDGGAANHAIYRQRVTDDVRRWAVQKFGRELTRRERDLGLLGLCDREANP